MRVELINGQNIENGIRNVAAAGRLSRASGTVFDILYKCDVYEKNNNVIKSIIDMGHKSIIEHDYLVFAISDVTPIIEHILIGFRLASFTVKSRREVDFSDVGFYVPDLSYLDNGKELGNTYVEHMNYLFKEYSNLLDMGIIKEDARFILPYCYHSNMIMGCDARELEKIIDYCLNSKMSKIAEVKQFGEHMLNIATKNAPYLQREFCKFKDHSEDSFSNLDKLIGKFGSYKYDIIDKPKLIGYTPNSDDIILTSVFMERYQQPFNRANLMLNEARKVEPNVDNEIMSILYSNSEYQRALEQVNFTFEMSYSLASLTHMLRHRMHSLVVPDFVPMWDLDKYIVPDTIKNTCEEKYHEIYKINQDMYKYFKEQGVKEEDLVYFYLSGNMCNVHTTMNARTLMWISRMRCCNKAQWEVRKNIQACVDEVKKVSPLLGNYLGATCEVEHKCYEGRECCGKVKQYIGGNK